MRLVRAGNAVVLLTLLSSLFVQAQDKQIKKVPITPTQASSGQQMFVAYCATCHGKDGKGAGPAASALKKAPADLTLLSQKNGGKFPESHVILTIRSDDSPVHGSHEMPIWGPLLSSVSSSEGEVQLRATNLAKYIETLQTR
jgi:mono/diheme cytochrome c family protein